MGKIKALVTEIQEEFTLSFDDAMAVTNKVLAMYSEQQGVGTLFDDLRSVVDQYRGENNRLWNTVHSLEEEIARLQQLNAKHEQLNESLRNLAESESGMAVPTSSTWTDGTQPTEYR